MLWSEAVIVEEGALTGVMPEPLPDEPEEPVRSSPETVKRAASAARTAPRRPRRPRPSRPRPPRRPPPSLPPGRRRPRRRPRRAPPSPRPPSRPGSPRRRRGASDAALHQVIVRRVVTEKQLGRLQTRWNTPSRSTPRPTVPDPRGAAEALRGHGHRGAHHAGAPAFSHPRPHARHDGAVEEGDRHTQGRRLDRRVRGLDEHPTVPAHDHRTRFRSVSGFGEITRGTPEKSLLSRQRSPAGATIRAT